ncbi:MAG: NYN domain-containing protein [Chloroflexota bacterium]|nr:NYN domain-containing protein [Chloroflexota bacterium]
MPNVTPTSQAVVVFLDYQNLYMSARETFYPPRQPGDPPLPWIEGQFDPLKLAQRIVARALTTNPRHMKQVRIYRGEPRFGVASKAFNKQVLSWKQSPLVEVVSRPVRRQPSGKTEEKGIDVRLTVDFISMAITRQYDIGILMSEDTDLVPAIEAALALPPATGVICEVAAWKPMNGYARRLNVPGTSLWCHFMSEADYRTVADPTDYTR